MKYALEREFHDYNKVSCDVERWLPYEAMYLRILFYFLAFRFYVNIIIVERFERVAE